MNVKCPKGGRHQWFVEYDNDPCCRKCRELMGRPETIGFLNAAMQLTADEAEKIRMDDTTPEGSLADKRLSAYAAAWREA